MISLTLDSHGISSDVNLRNDLAVQEADPPPNHHLRTASECTWQPSAFSNRPPLLRAEECVHELVYQQAQRTPNAVAVEFESQFLTYAELDRKSDLLAHVLRSLELRPDDLIAVCVERSLELIVALIGVLKAGAAFLPLDPKFPAERLRTVLRDAQPRAALTTGDANRNLLDCFLGSHSRGDYESTLPLIYLDAEAWDGMPDEGLVNSGRETKLEHLAYVVYKPDSARQPTGVEVSHGAFANFLQAMRERPGISPEDTLLAITPASFDIAGLELLLPLTVGAKVVIASEWDSSSATRLAKFADRIRPTIMQATPTVWRQLIEAGWQGHYHLKVLCGGESWSRSLAEQLHSRCHSLWNMYGPTEGTIWSAVEAVGPEGPIVIGEPIANTTLVILDQHQCPVPAGVPGELYIAGSGLARGYHRQPELTAEKFVSVASQHGRSGRLYRTGDLARYGSNGKIEFLGRIDAQAKIQGFCVALDEVEAALLAHAAISQAVVTVSEDDFGYARLIGHVIKTPGATVSDDELRHFLRRTLPDHVVPITFLNRTVMPMAPSGKIDRRALCSTGTSFTSEREHRNQLERTILAIWREVLDAQHMTLHDDFFSLGRDSSLVSQAHRRMREILGHEIPITCLQQHTTVRSLCEFLVSAAQRKTRFDAPPNEEGHQTGWSFSHHEEQEAAV